MQHDAAVVGIVNGETVDGPVSIVRGDNEYPVVVVDSNSVVPVVGRKVMLDVVDNVVVGESGAVVVDKDG